MKIHVAYMAQLRRLAGRASEEVSLPEGGTLTDLLRRLAEAHGATLSALLVSERGQPHSSVLAFRREEQCGSDAVLSDGDCVTLLTPMAGGSGDPQVTHSAILRQQHR